MERGRASMEHRPQNGDVRGERKDPALMHKIRAMEHDGTRRRPANEIGSEVRSRVSFRVAASRSGPGEHISR